MQQVQDWHFLRTDEERDAQIKAQALRIDAVQKQIQAIQVNINNVDAQIMNETTPLHVSYVINVSKRGRN